LYPSLLRNQPTLSASLSGKVLLGTNDLQPEHIHHSRPIPDSSCWKPGARTLGRLAGRYSGGDAGQHGKNVSSFLFLAIPHGTFIFAHSPAYEWCLSFTAIGLTASWSSHNVIAWMKSMPFLSRRVSLFYISTVILAQAYWVTFTSISFVCSIKPVYSFGIVELMMASPRFGIMLVSMCLSIIFMIIETCSVLHALNAADLPTRTQPVWKLSFVFKCLCDTVILDDFNSPLDQIRSHRFQRSIPTGEVSLCRYKSPQQADVEAGFDPNPRLTVPPKRDQPLPRVVLREDAGTQYYMKGSKDRDL
ncbi:hypothetical protein N7467_006917, partial [Penicillium canescens]